jgi:ABC transport system ATP-binding/permease protein
MNYLSVELLSKSYAEKVLFKDISFGIDYGQKVAIVAKNGSGKSSLLNCLTGKDVADKGQITFRNDLRVGYLHQEQDYNPEATIIDTVYDSDSEMLQLLRDYRDSLNNGDADNRMEELTGRITELGGWDMDSLIQEVLSKLQLHDMHQKVGMLSGGQKRRLALAKVIIEQPQLLILDEPTNHLDVEMIEWLEEYLAQNHITLLMVTHDRYFLERVCNEIMELDGGNLYRYKGNYSYYLEKREERQSNQQASIDKAKNLFSKELEWMRRQPKARSTKAKSRIDAFYDTKEAASQKIDHSKVEIQVQMERMGNKILEFHHVSKAFGEKKILTNWSYLFKRKERVGLVGANGAGKTTLLNLITENLSPDSGKIITGETIVYGYYNQKGLELKEDKRVIDVIRDIAEYLPIGGGKKLTAVQLLEKFLFAPSSHYQYVSTLSGGERKRLYLITILMKNPNFLILDEPTNDLDIFTLQVLEDYLLSFEGCLIVVSHDRYFMDKLVDHIFILNGDGSITDILGNYGEYRIYRTEQEKERKSQKQKVETPIPVTSSDKPKNKPSFKEKQEFEKLDAEIPALEAKRIELSKKLSEAGLSQQELERFSNEITQITTQIDSKSLRWMELADLME